MSFDLMLKPSCSGCGSTTDLYGSNCKHMTLCLTCGKTMAESLGKCYDCGATEYNVRVSPDNDKNYFIGRFVTGLPSFSKKKNAENKWSLHKEGLQGRQLTDVLRGKYKNKPWLLEDETGQFQYQGHLEGSQSATYYLLILQGKEFVAIPAGSWCDWEHEEIFTDDDEQLVMIRGTGRLGPQVPAPPEIKQMDEDVGVSSVLAPKKDAPKEEPADNSPTKPIPSGSAKGTPSTSKSAKGKRKLNGDDSKASTGGPQRR
ncbi:hypothetical protein GH714_034143 [Hevea brasiliensis]|uniref:Transcription initiation factor IIF subunit alpha n=1 Tax=Hevea brasiliensis TaxID=3981 RepID=A0A6A6LPA7_HEVBR|nr:hypothetical protein GH714_034143 [Hevea brasiliensis]